MKLKLGGFSRHRPSPQRRPCGTAASCRKKGSEPPDNAIPQTLRGVRVQVLVGSVPLRRWVAFASILSDSYHHPPLDLLAAHNSMTLERRHGSPSTAASASSKTHAPATRDRPAQVHQRDRRHALDHHCHLRACYSSFSLATIPPLLPRKPSDAGPKASKSRPGPWARVVAALRVLAYRRLPSYRLGLINLRLPVLGATLAMSAFMLASPSGRSSCSPTTVWIAASAVHRLRCAQA